MGQGKVEVFAMLLAIPPSEVDGPVRRGTKFTLTTWKGFDPDD